MNLKRTFPYICFFLLSIVYFWPVIFGSGILLQTNPKTIRPWNEVESSDPSSALMLDSLTLLYPWRVFNANVLRSGEVPHWNPYILCGYPHLAALQSHSLYPGTLVFDLVDPVRGIAGSMALHLALSGALMFLFLKRIGLSVEASFIGALTFEFNGMFLVRMGSPSYVFSSVWIPMMLIGAHALAEKMNFKNSLALIFGVALSFLGGHPQIFTIGVVVTGLFFLFQLRENLSIKKLFLNLSVFALACCAGLMLAAFELIPFAELIRNTARETIPLEIYRKAAPPFVIAIQAIIPDFFGHPVDRNYWFNEGVELLGRGNKFLAPSFNFFEDNLFTGVVPLFLVGVALFRNRTAYTLFFSMLLFAMLAILFGTPLLDAVYYLLPSFRFSRPDRIITVYVLCISVLTGIGYQALQQRQSSGKNYGKYLLFGFGILIILIIAPYLFDPRSFEGFQKWLHIASERFGKNPSAKSGLLNAVVLFITSALLSVWMIKTARLQKVFLPIWALMILLPCYFFGWKFNPIQHEPLFPANKPQTILSGEASHELYRIVRTFGRRGQKYFPSNIPATMKVFDVNGASAAPVDVYIDFVRLLDPDAITRGKYFWEFSNPRLANRRLLDFLNVKYVISDTALPYRTEPLYTDDQFRIYQNPGYLPRFFLVYSAEPYQDIKHAQTRLIERDFDPAQSVLISQEQFRNVSLNGNGNGSVRTLRYEPNYFELEIISDKNAVVASSEVYYPGWRATLNGQPAKVLLINTAFRGLYIPAGKHRVIFSYYPSSFRIGTTISIVTFSILLILMWFSFKAKQ